MTSRYIANTSAEQRDMLRTIGAASIEDLLVRIPPKARLSRPLALAQALAEADLIRHRARSPPGTPTRTATRASMAAAPTTITCRARSTI